MKARGARLTRPFLLTGILALALLLRAFQLTFQPLWWDEGYSVFFATRDIGTLLARTAVDIHPPLYYLLLQAWIALLGTSDLALRLLSVVIGMATLPFIYLVARQVAGRAVALISISILAISPLHIYYSQEVRMYGLVTLLVLASAWLMFALLRRETRSAKQPWLLWPAYIIVSAAALYTQYFAAFFLVAQALVILLTAREWRTLRTWIVAWACIMILYLPWLVYAGPKLYSYVTAKVGIEQYSILDPLTFLAQHLSAFSVGHVSVIPELAWASALLVALAILGLIAAVRDRTRGHLVEKSTGTKDLIPIVVLFLVPLALGWLVNLVYTFHPVHYERLLLFAAPFFYILAALGLRALWLRTRVAAWLALVAIAAVSIVSLRDFYTVPRYADEDYRPLIADMQSLASTGDTILAPYPWQIGYLATYYRGPSIAAIEIPGDEWDRLRSSWEDRLTALQVPGSRIWLLAYQTKGRRLEDQIANLYSADYRLLDDWYGNTRLEYFGTAADPSLVDRIQDLAPDVRLVSYGAASADATPGKTFVPVRLRFQATSNAYSFSIRLVDGNGDKKTQQDVPISPGDDVERRGLVVPANLPEGGYQVRLVVYRRSDGAPLSFAGGATELVMAQVVVKAPR